MLLDSLRHHRLAMANLPTYSDAWYHHMKLTGQLVREWRETNTLTAV